MVKYCLVLCEDFHPKAPYDLCIEIDIVGVLSFRHIEFTCAVMTIMWTVIFFLFPVTFLSFY